MIAWMKSKYSFEKHRNWGTGFFHAKWIFKRLLYNDIGTTRKKEVVFTPGIVYKDVDFIISWHDDVCIKNSEHISIDCVSRNWTQRGIIV